MLRWAVVSVPVQTPDTLLDEHVLALFENSFGQTPVQRYFTEL